MSGENLFWLGNRNKKMMDSYLAALPFASKAFKTLSGATERRERLVPGTSIHAAGLGQDGFWQNSHTLPDELPCKAEGVPVVHTSLSFVPHTQVKLSPGKNYAFQHHLFFSPLIFS